MGESERETLLHIGPIASVVISLCFSMSFRIFLSAPSIESRHGKAELISEHHRDSVNVMFYILLAVLTQKREPAQRRSHLLNYHVQTVDAIALCGWLCVRADFAMCTSLHQHVN
jgi:hypothetical protein